MCLPRAGHGALQLPNGEVLLIAGHTEKDLADGDDDLTATVEVLNLETKQFAPVGRLIMARADPIMVIRQPNQVIVAGGVNVNNSGDYRWVREAESFMISDVYHVISNSGKQ